MSTLVLQLWVERYSAGISIMLLFCDRRMVMVEQIYHRLDQINRQREDDRRVFLNSDFRQRLQVAELERNGL